MNLYPFKPEIKLALNAAASESLVYFQEYSTVCDHGVSLCAHGLHRYVRLPKSTREITLVFFKRHVAESFEIGRRVVPRKSYNSLMFHEVQQYCMIDHPKTQLLQSFRSELYRYYINGFKFFRIEY